MLYAFSALVCLYLCSRGSSVSSSRSSGSVARTGPLAAAAALTACIKKWEAPSAPAVLTSSLSGGERTAMGAISSGAIMYESSSPSGAVTTASGLSFAAREWPGNEVRARVGRGCRDD